jgi:hypothetical protein
MSKMIKTTLLFLPPHCVKFSDASALAVAEEGASVMLLPAGSAGCLSGC